MSQFSQMTSRMIRVSSLSEASMKLVLAAGEAERCLLEYRPEGAQIGRNEFFAMLDLLREGKSPADAAEIVQAKAA